MKQIGFTLVEMLTAVAIIVILSAISFIQYSRIQENARINGARAFDSHLNRILGSALAGEWKLDGNAEDSSGNGKHGVIQGTGVDTNETECMQDRCASFTGDGYVDIGSADNMKGTISAWVYRTFANNNSGSNPTAISLGHNGDISRIEFYYDIGDGNFYCRYFDSWPSPSLDIKIGVEPSTIKQNKWHHITMSWDVTGDAFKCYIDGVMVGNIQNGLSGNERQIYGLENGTIGSEALNPSGGADMWEGRIDEVRIYDKYFD